MQKYWIKCCIPKLYTAIWTKLFTVYNILYHKYQSTQTDEPRVLHKAPTLIGVWNWEIGYSHRLSAQR